jgi:ribose 5-phosphate isomerase B
MIGKKNTSPVFKIYSQQIHINFVYFVKMKKLLVIASDHAGFPMKQMIREHLSSRGIRFEDLGTDSETPSDYPDFGHPLAEAIESGDYDLGISICGSGNGINMTTNKHQGIRGAVCWNEEISRLAREHNDANICSIPARFVDQETALKIVDAFLEARFEGGRHIARIRKISLKSG